MKQIVRGSLLLVFLSCSSQLLSQDIYKDYPFYNNKVYRIALTDGDTFEAQFVKRDTVHVFFKLSDLSDRITPFDELAAVSPSKTDPFFNDPTKAVHVKVKFKEEGRKNTIEGFVVDMDEESIVIASYIGDMAEKVTLGYESIKSIRTLNYHAALPQGFNSVVIGLGAGILLGASGNIYALISAPFVTTGIILIGYNKNLTKVKYTKSGLEKFRMVAY